LLKKFQQNKKLNKKIHKKNTKGKPDIGDITRNEAVVENGCAIPNFFIVHPRKYLVFRNFPRKDGGSSNGKQI
jgi:hypothetical protein